MEAFQGGTTEDHLGVAVNQPGDSVIVKGKWPFFYYKSGNKGGPADFMSVPCRKL